MDKSQILSLPSKIIVDDCEHFDLMKIFGLLKSGVSLSMQVVFDFNGLPTYVLFLDKSGLESKND